MQRIELIKDLNKSPNEQISYLQKRLIDWDLLTESDIDGVFGDNTESAIKLFQEKKNLEVTGIVNNETWAALEELPVEKNEEVQVEVEPFTLDEAVKLITTFETVSLKAYKQNREVYIGYGSTKNLDGSSFKLGDRLVNKTQARELLVYQLETEIVPKLEESIPYWDKLNTNQKNALISFAHNCGSSFYGTQGFDTLAKYLKEQVYTMIPKTLVKYVKKGGLNRRQLEGQLFSKV